MFSRKDKNKENLDVAKLNDVITLSNKILKIVYVLSVVLGVYIAIMVCKELKITGFFITVLATISPLFIGIFVAWLFDPFVTFLQRKGMRRGMGTFITYLLFIGALAIIVGAIIPVLYEQVNDFVKGMPSTFDTIKGWINGAFDKIGNIDGIDAESVRVDLFKRIEEFGVGITSSLPEMIVRFVKALFSGMGTLIVGLIIGFYLLLTFDNANDLLITLTPKKLQHDTRDLVNEVNTSLRKFIQGALADCGLIFVVTSIAFGFIGLKSPLLFGLFCGITNIIPYAGPYIGGAPAVIVGYSQGPLVGTLTLISIFVVQFLEGNLLQPLIMSKTTKLHPVTIMLGLLVFGHFFGILGMVISTPVIAALKTIFLFFDEKFGFLNID